LEAREDEFWKYVEAINWSGAKEREGSLKEIEHGI